MDLLLKLLFLYICVLYLFNRCTRSYINPYTLTMVFGKKGSGKSTLLTKLAIKHIKSGWKVYSTMDIPNTYKLDTNWIGKFQPPANSVFLIDEVGMIWDNRDFKNFKPEVRDFFKLQRHYRIKVYLFSQTFDVDKKLRDLTDEMYLIKKYARVFSLARRIVKYDAIVQKQDGNSDLSEGYKFAPVILPSSWRFTFIPRYTCFFDSFETPKLSNFPHIHRSPDPYYLSMYSDKTYFENTFKNYVNFQRIKLSLLKIHLKYTKRGCIIIKK